MQDKNFTKILTTYRIALPYLRQKERAHFLDRAYLATRYPIFHKEICSSSIPRRKDYVQTYLDSTAREKRLKEISNVYANAPFRTRRIAQKKKQIAKYPHLLLFSKIIVHMHYIKYYTGEDLTGLLPLSFIRQVEKDLFAAQEFTKDVVVVSTNIIYFAKNLGIFDLEMQYIEQFQKIFAQVEKIDDSTMWTNYLYGLTHMIIGASAFYQRSIDRNKYEWIFQKFDQYQEQIRADPVYDITLEVALCCKLSNQLTSHWIKEGNELINKQVKTSYMENRYKNTSLNAVEHVNALALLLLSPNLKL